MRRVVYILVPLLLVLPLLWAQEKQKAKDQKADAKPQTVEDQFKEIMSLVQKDLQKAREAYQNAATDAERTKIQNDFRKNVSSYTGRCLEMVEKNPKDKAAMEVLTFVLRSSLDEKTIDKAVELILKEYVDDPDIKELALGMAGTGSSSAEKLLHGLLEKSTNPKIQGVATLGLAQVSKAKSEAAGLKLAEAQKLSKEAEDKFQQIITQFATQKDLVKQAKSSLEELQKFGIGRKAPEVAGEDGDSKKFSLSDYKGKVVVLDFWASW